MLDLLVNTIAVPFGYSSDLIDSDFILTTDMCTNDLRNHNGWSLLPDIIQSNTPPPSPLRRALSSTFVFPEKGSKTLQPKTESNANVEEEATRGLSQTSQTDAQEDAKKENLHEPKVTSQRPSGGSQSSGDEKDLNLPELSWRLYKRSSSPDLCQEALKQENDKRSCRDDEEVMRYTKLQEVGCDLRKIADQFERSNAKVTEKRDDDVELNVALPLAFNRCISASIFFLIWWRLLNKFR